MFLQCECISVVLWERRGEGWGKVSFKCVYMYMYVCMLVVILVSVEYVERVRVKVCHGNTGTCTYVCDSED